MGTRFGAQLPAARHGRSCAADCLPSARSDNRNSVSSYQRRMAKTAITQTDVKQEIRKSGEEIKGQHSAHGREVDERDEQQLGARGKGNIEPRADNPSAGGVQRPEDAGDHVERRAADHEEKLALQMRISVSQDKKKFVRQKGRAAEDEQAETHHAAGDSGIEPA